jgi:uncharacterized membrane protein YhaH (DUF805 family)
VNPIESLTKCLGNYFNGKGRASRSEFWWFALIYYGTIYAAGSTLSEFGSGLLTLVTLALVIPLWNAGFRRLHDVGVRGWFMLVPVANIFLLASKGELSENKYGVPPLK